MPNLTISIPVGLVPELIQVAKQYLDDIPVDYSAMTTTQIGQRYLAEVMKKDLKTYRQRIANAAAQAAITTAQVQASAAVVSAVQQAVVDSQGITG